MPNMTFLAFYPQNLKSLFEPTHDNSIFTFILDKSSPRIIKQWTAEKVDAICACEMVPERLF